MLFGNRHIEDGGHCVQSALEIRAMLTQEINAARPGKTLEQVLKVMRAACRRFVDAAGPNAENFFCEPRPYEANSFGLALGDLRTSIGLQVALMADMFGLTVDETLVPILPPDDDDASWIPGFDIQDR